MNCESVVANAHRTCPYHAAVQHKAYLMEIFRDGANDEDFPLFPDREGRELKADNVVDFIELVALMCGEPITTKGGLKRFGKHSFRATGAVWLTAMGVEIYKVQILGRWICGVVLHYCRLAPLKTIADDFKRGS